MINQLYMNENGEFLSAVTFLPAGNVRACVVFVHAYSNWKDEHDFMFCRMANAFNQKNIAALTFDMRGHGESDKALEEISVSTMKEDIVAAVEYAKNNICSEVYVVTVGFSARLCAEALGNTVAGYALLSPVTEIPQSLKCLADYDGCTIGEVFGKLADSAQVVQDMELMGMLPKFVTAELVNADIYSTGEYVSGQIEAKTIVFASNDTMHGKEVFTNCERHIYEEGGILFRSPIVLEKITNDIIHFIN